MSIEIQYDPFGIRLISSTAPRYLDQNFSLALQLQGLFATMVMQKIVNLESAKLQEENNPANSKGIIKCPVFGFLSEPERIPMPAPANP